VLFKSSNDDLPVMLVWRNVRVLFDKQPFCIMSKIHIERECHLPREELLRHIDQLADKLKDSLEVEYVRHERGLTFTRKGASGYILVDEGNIEVEIALGIVFKPFRKRIEHTVLDYLDDYFA
jgi:hypothetical protein